ncbi:hypothetical protein E2562_000612 [Oryza meyeriana var. granulata]|uniref:BHLH domain-containing protein n=1 Tax=Oryza meyeriana var. granulata TaxID=110450 RepID=A0A6G1DU29_9ORYZ|nr:hypothetical protein E2562_000612 [Oryza meyeriana var. granulata]
MDSSSWIHGFTNANAGGGNNGFMCGYAASCSPGEFQQQQMVSSQIQHHLNQISMQMGMDDESAVYDAAAMVDDLLMASSTHHAAGSFPSSPSSSASYRSASVSYSPESSAAAAHHVLGAPAAATGFQYPEVTSQAPLPLPLAPYEPQHGHYTGVSPAAELRPETGGAFRRYARHLSPRRPPKPGACGQKMFKTAMSVLAKMQIATTYSRQYYYQQAAAAEAAPPSGNQLQHMISERKRREKLNDSFGALKAVLPPGSKKDKTSILIRAREYVKSLESKLSELEEKNRELEARLASRPAVVAKDCEDETAAPPESGDEMKGEEDLVEIEVTSGGAGSVDTAVVEEETCTLNVAVTTPPSRRGGAMSTTDVVLRTLQCLREQIGDGASLVAMSTSAGSGGRPPRANLTLQLKV